METDAIPPERPAIAAIRDWRDQTRSRYGTGQLPSDASDGFASSVWWWHDVDLLLRYIDYLETPVAPAVAPEDEAPGPAGLSGPQIAAHWQDAITPGGHCDPHLADKVPLSMPDAG